MNVAVRPDLGFDCISLCTGGGGLDLAVELALPGARSVALVEREAFAVAHLVEAMQHGLLAPAPVWSDVRTFPGRRFRGLVDLVHGGIPCQPHSLAGKRLGRDDPRDLWGAARRIVVQTGAWAVLIENVGGMLSSGGAERVWRDLQRLGFAVEGGLFTAAEVGASHERERFFMLGVADARCAAACGGQPGKPDRTNADGGEGLADAERHGWGEGCGPLQPRAGEPGPGPGGKDLANASCDRQFRGPQPHLGPVEPGQQAPRRGDAERRDHDVVDAVRRLGHWRPDLEVWRPGGRAAARRSGGGPLFAPGPGDVDAWGALLADRPHLEPAVRRVVDGLAGGVHDDGSWLAWAVRHRVDRLRMLGNGVVPLEGAYALRTLTARLAARRSRGAALLVRMMEAA